MKLVDVLNKNHNDLSDHDLATLADWANDWKQLTPNPDWKRAFALIREGADLLLRRRARSSMNLDNHIGKPPDTGEPTVTGVAFKGAEKGVSLEIYPL